ncbi:MAG: MAPEG family protein [Burkholderiales bacterium]|nr:MAPEG family protein [Burkholderiales bacterium]
MRDTALLIPMFVLAGWTGLVLVYVAISRVRGGVAPREYTLGESPQVPARAVLANRNYMNLLELPLLFYVICLLAWVTPPVPAAALPLAWAYAGLRIVHSLIHLSYNRVMHRFLVFGLSNGALVALWVVVGRAVLTA